MVPRPTRRRYVSSLSLAALGALAGCIGSSGSGGAPTSHRTTEESTTEETTTEKLTTEGTTTEEPTTEETTTESESNSSAAESPAAAFRQYITTATEDPATTREYFHPIHPFGPEKLSPEEAVELFGQSNQPKNVSVETERRDLSAEAVHQQSFLQHADLETDDVASAIEGEQTAVVEADVTQADGETENNRLVMVTHDGGWVILAQAFQPSGSAADPGPFDARVVENVTFDTDEDTARVEFVASPVADEVTVKAEEAFSERSTTTPQPIEYFDLQVDSGGDTLIVTATIDGETREVHREQYPPSEAVVEDVTYDDDPDSDARDATARIVFNDDADWGSDTLTVEATVSGYEATFESGNAADYAVAGIDPSGDEIVVSRTEDGESTVVHRERYHP